MKQGIGSSHASSIREEDSCRSAHLWGQESYVQTSSSHCCCTQGRGAGTTEQSGLWSPSYSKSLSLLYIMQLEFMFIYSSYSTYYLLMCLLVHCAKHLCSFSYSTPCMMLILFLSFIRKQRGILVLTLDWSVRKQLWDLSEKSLMPWRKMIMVFLTDFL